jgi:ribosomal protein S10
MFIGKKHIPRRTFLRGAGVTIALPLLEAMLPAQTPLRQTAAARVRRFVGVWHPHGAAPGYWSPVQEGSNFDFSYITKPLEPFRDRIVLVSGLDVPEAFSTEEQPGGNHARGAVFLSGSRPRRDTVSPYLGVTIDQLIANKYGADTLLSSIQLGVEDSNSYGDCNWGYSCAYTNCMSWTSATQPLPTQINPRVAFERLFGDGASAEERLLGRKQNASILDSVTREIPRLKKDLGAGDRSRLDTYLDNIRELERRIRIAIDNPVPEPADEIPFGIPRSKDIHFKLMFDLIALAFQGDITRSATMMLGRDISLTVFPESGVTTAWHGTSHHGDKPENVANYAKMNRYHVGLLAYFCEKLRNIPDGDGSILDHVLIYKGSNMGNSHRHAHEKVPVILVGGIDGNFKGNRHIVFPDNTERTSNLLLSILHLFGIERDSIGTSTRPLPIV